jgi:DNA-binding protein H-NS
MPKQSFAQMSLDGLVQLREQIGSVISERADAMRKQLASIGEGHAPARRGRPGRKGRAGMKVAAKYRDPKTGATWSGRGAPARWISEYEKAGKKRDSFLIAKQDGAGAKSTARRGAKKGRRGRPRKAN